MYRPSSGLSPKTVLALIRGLPVESRTYASIGDMDQRWALTDYLVASVVDAVNQNTYVFAQAQTKKKIQKPNLLPRPGKNKAKTNKPSQFAFMARQARAKAMRKE